VRRPNGDGQGDDCRDGCDPGKKDQSEATQTFQRLQRDEEELADDEKADQRLDRVEGPVRKEVEGVLLEKSMAKRSPLNNRKQDQEGGKFQPDETFEPEEERPLAQVHRSQQDRAE
jgi:hypothetical protein